MKTEFTFAELSDRAQQKALDYFRETNVHEDMYEFVFEDAATVADLFGLDIRNTRKTLMDGSHRYDPTIYFSGFASQGDGACFQGRYRYKAGALKAVKAHAPQDTELHRIVKDLQITQARYFYKLAAECKHRGHYYHSGCMQVEVWHDDDQYRDIGNAEDDIRDLLREFADYIYKRLENEYDYQTSDEAIKESIEANEYLFDEDGNVI